MQSPFWSTTTMRMRYSRNQSWLSNLRNPPTLQWAFNSLFIIRKLSLSRWANRTRCFYASCFHNSSSMLRQGSRWAQNRSIFLSNLVCSTQRKSSERSLKRPQQLCRWVLLSLCGRLSSSSYSRKCSSRCGSWSSPCSFSCTFHFGR